MLSRGYCIQLSKAQHKNVYNMNHKEEVESKWNAGKDYRDNMKR